jgi:hypothetical protein
MSVLCDLETLPRVICEGSFIYRCYFHLEPFHIGGFHCSNIFKKGCAYSLSPPWRFNVKLIDKSDIATIFVAPVIDDDGVSYYSLIEAKHCDISLFWTLQKFMDSALNLLAGHGLSVSVLSIERKNHLLKLREIMIAEGYELWNLVHKVTPLEIIFTA